MKVSITIILLICTTICFSQEKDTKSWSPQFDKRLTKFSAKWENKDRPIYAWAVGMNGYRKHGILQSVTDTSLIIIHKRDYLNNEITGTHPTKVNYLILRETKRKGKHMLIMTPIGIAIGVIVMAVVPQFGGLERFEMMAIGGVYGGVAGLASSLIVGSFKLKIPMKGSMKNFEKSKKRLQAIAVDK